MLTKNAETLLRFWPIGRSCGLKFKTIIGQVYAIDHNGLLSMLSTLTNAPVVNEFNSLHPVILFGENGEPESKDSFSINKLNSLITADVKVTTDLNESDGYCSNFEIRIIWNSDDTKTIREVGLAVHASYGSSSIIGNFILLDRTVLKSPITLSKGDVAVINYKIANTSKIHGE